MKTHKKLFLALGIVLTGALFITSSSHRAYAATLSETDITNCIDTMVMQDAATITCTVGGQTLSFTDKQPTDDLENYAPNQTGDFCDPGNNSALSAPDPQYGLDLYDSGQFPNSGGPEDILDSGTPNPGLTEAGQVAVTFDLGYDDANGNCVLYNYAPLSKAIPIEGGGPTFLQWVTVDSPSPGDAGSDPAINDIVTLNGVTQGTLANVSFERVSDTAYDPGGGTYLYASSGGVDITSCSGQLLAVSVDSNGLTSATLYTLSSSGSAQDADLSNVLGGSSCHDTASSLGTFYVRGTAPSDYEAKGTGSVTGAVPGGGSTVTTATSCYSGGLLHEIFSLEWILCPILGYIDNAVGVFDGLISDYLNFDTCTNLNIPAAGQTCATGTRADPTEQAWEVMRTLATVVLVIIMLVMVISQAVGGGPFDAYTVRKMLPRLVVAVIAIQFSWVMFGWMINVFDALGNGIQALMYLPFGGYTHMTLQALLSGYSDCSSATATNCVASGNSFNVFELLLLGGIGAAGYLLTIGGVLALAVPVLIAVIVGFFVLIARKILIILLMITAPLALVAWILPGTQRYFKMWWDNFIKLLAMFPLIVALLSAGRIFAYISNNSGAAGFSLSTFIFVIVGYFGPYAVLPKTFKWGGQAMGALGGAIVTSGQRVSQPAQKYFGGLGAANRQQRAIARSERLSEGTGRPLDNLWAGKYNFGLSGEARAHRYHDTLEKGRKAGEEEAARSIIGSEYESLDHNNKLDTLRNVAQGNFDGRTDIDGSNPAAQRWALDQLATFGDWDIISNMREKGQIKERAWQMFVAKNISAIHQNAPHLSPQRSDLSKIGYQDFATMKGVGFEELERQFRTGTDRDPANTRPVDNPDKVAKQLRMQDQARRALDDERVRANLDANAIATLERIRDAKVASPTTQIIRSRGGGITSVVPPDASFLRTTPDSTANLDSHIFSPDVTTANYSRAGVATQLASSELRGENLRAVQAYLGELKVRAGTSSQAKKAYNEIVAAADTELNMSIQEVERRAAAQGMTPVEIENARKREEARVASVRQRMIDENLTRLP
jgi:hypothetical protein